MSRYIKSIIWVVVIMAILNYIPIQFAKKPPNKAKVNHVLRCVTEPKLDDNGSKWVARKNDNTEIDNDLVFNIIGDNPDDILNPNCFDVKSWHRSIRADNSVSDTLENVFIIYHKNALNDIFLTSIADAENWDIVYPIKRSGWRRFVTPKSYLSIYDFNLKKIRELVNHI